MAISVSLFKKTNFRQWWRRCFLSTLLSSCSIRSLCGNTVKSLQLIILIAIPGFLLAEPKGPYGGNYGSNGEDMAENHAGVDADKMIESRGKFSESGENRERFHQFPQESEMNDVDAPYGINLLNNPNAEAGDMSDWLVMENGGRGWLAHTSASNSRENGFKTSYDWATRGQTVDLLAQGFSETVLDQAPPILISEAFRKVYCAGEYFLEVALLDAAQQVLHTWSSGVRKHADESCDREEYLEFLEQKLSHYGPGVRYLRWRDGGRGTTGSQDQHYGPQLENAYLAVLPRNLLNDPEDIDSWTWIENRAAINTEGTQGERKFLTSHMWSRRQQLLDLVAAGYSSDTLDESPPIMVSASYGKILCADKYYLKVELLDANQRVLKSWDSGERQHVKNVTTGRCAVQYTNYKEMITAFLDYGPGVRYLRWEDGGRDSEGWKGHYGAILQDPYIGVLERSQQHRRILDSDFLADVAMGGLIGAVVAGTGCALMTGGVAAPVCFAVAGVAYSTASVVATGATIGSVGGLTYYSIGEPHHSGKDSTTVHWYTQKRPLVEKYNMSAYYGNYTVHNNVQGQPGYTSALDHLVDTLPAETPRLSEDSSVWLQGFEKGSCLTGALDTIDNIIYLYPVASSDASDSSFQCTTPTQKLPIADEFPNYEAIVHDPYKKQEDWSGTDGPSHVQILIRQSPHYTDVDDVFKHGIGFFLQVLGDGKYMIDFNSRSLHRWKFTYSNQLMPNCNDEPRCFPPQEWSDLIGDTLLTYLLR